MKKTFYLLLLFNFTIAFSQEIDLKEELKSQFEIFDIEKLDSDVSDLNFHSEQVYSSENHIDSIHVFYGENADARVSYIFNSEGYCLFRTTCYYSNNKWNNQSLIQYYFNENNKLKAEIILNWINNQWIGNSKQSFKYDELGYRTETLYQKWENGQWENVRKFNTFYNHEEHSKLMLQQKWNIEEWEFESKNLIIEDAHGNLILDSNNRYSKGQYAGFYKRAFIYNDNFDITLRTVEDNKILYNRVDLLEQKYDNNFNIIEKNIKNFSNSNIRSHYRIKFTYDDRNNQLSETHEDVSGSHVSITRKVYFTYDDMNQKLTFLSEFFKADTMFDSKKYTYEYDDNGNKTLNLEEKLIGDKWQKLSEQSESYNDDNLLLSYIVKRWNNTVLSYDSRMIFEYDDNGNRIFWINGHFKNNRMKEGSRTTYTYDSNNNELSSLKEQFSDNEWEYQTRTTSTYQNNKQTHLLSEGYINNEWVNSYQKLWKYNDNGVLIDQFVQQWNKDEWLGYWRYVWEFNEKNDLLSASSYYWEDGEMEYRNTADLNYQYLKSDDYFINLSEYCKINIFYQPGTSVEEELSKEKNVKAYPNPFSESTKIEYTLLNAANVKLDIYDAAGNFILTLVNDYQEKGTKSIRFNGEHLSSGIYYYQLRIGNDVFSDRLLLLK